MKIINQKYVKSDWLYKNVGSFCVTIIIKRILKKRTEVQFINEWEKCALPYNENFEIFKLIQKEYAWPNYFFFPDDDLIYLCKGYRDGLEYSLFIMTVEYHYSIELFDNHYFPATLKELILIINKLRGALV